MFFSTSTPAPDNENGPRLRHGRADGRQLQVTFVLGLIAFISAALIFGQRVKVGLRLFEFGDESEKFVAAQMLNQGLHLYRDIFAHHGPLPYMIAHLYANFVSPTDFSRIRLAVVFLAGLSCLTIILSPILKSLTVRLWAAAAYLSVLSSVWVLQGIHMLLYHQIGGFLLVIVLTQMVVPALLGEKVTRIGLFFSGFACTLACFAAYAFGPAAVFLVVSTSLSFMASRERLTRHAKAICFGSITAVSLVVAWLISFGDLLGYLIYHFYFNQKIYAFFIRFSPRAIFNVFNLAFTPQRRIDALSFIFFILWIFIVAVMVWRKGQKMRDLLLRFGAIFFLVLAVLFMNPRGMYGFYNAGVVVVNLAMVSLMATGILQQQFRQISWLRLIPSLLFIVLSVAGTEQVSRGAVSSPYKVAKKDFMAYVADQGQEQGGIYEFVRSITTKDDKVLSLIFNPSFYIKTGRLPASGHYYYFPWQAAYNRRSILDYKIDICQDIAANRPAVIWFDNWRVWGGYAIGMYEPCVPALIKSRYTCHSGERNLYIRNDIAHDLKMDESPAESTPPPGPPFTR